MVNDKNNTKSIKMPTDIVSLIKLAKDLGILGAVIVAVWLMHLWVTPDIMENKNKIKEIEGCVNKQKEVVTKVTTTQELVVVPKIEKIEKNVEKLQEGQVEIKALLKK